MKQILVYFCIFFLISWRVPVALAFDDSVTQWQFKNHDRKVKAALIGSSISKFSPGNYGELLEGVCKQLEIQNLAKTSLGAHQLFERFQSHALGNYSLKTKKPPNLWLIYLGGLNSVEDPEGTINAIRKTFAKAHNFGMKVLGLSMLPWGSEKDYRWKGAKGLNIQNSTQLVVDFVLGKLDKSTAFFTTPLMKDEPKEFSSEEKADIAVDLYHSDLQDKNAPARNDAEKTLAKAVAANPWVQTKLINLQGEARTIALSELVEKAKNTPKWFMKKSFQSFDHFHPNKEGHQVLAKTICPHLPPEFACECALLPSPAKSP